MPESAAFSHEDSKPASRGPKRHSQQGECKYSTVRHCMPLLQHSTSWHVFLTTVCCFPLKQARRDDLEELPFEEGTQDTSA
eukprot:scaffold144167_cov21-Tisochrysis_lutea.AAC.1